jgi:DNA-binding transcriptional LysR family regulator
MNRQAEPKKTNRNGAVPLERFMTLVTFRQIRYFIAVAESGKISAAAAMLGISPSVVTDAIGELEALSRMALFRRQPRGLDLTYDGHRFLAHCRNILSAIEGANHALSRPDSEIEGKLKLATTITVAGYFLAPILSRFQKTFPNIQVEVVEQKRLDVEAGLIEGGHDLALMLVSNLSNRQKLLSHTLVHSMRRLWLPPKHPLLNQEIITLADVAELPYIQLAIDDAEATTGAYWRVHNLQPNIVIRTESVEAIRSLIAVRQGVTILSDMMYRPWSLEGNRIEVREVAAKIPTMNTGLVWSRARELSAEARAFIEFCRIEYDNRRLDVRRSMPIERE